MRDNSQKSTKTTSFISSNKINFHKKNKKIIWDEINQPKGIIPPDPPNPPNPPSPPNPPPIGGAVSAEPFQKGRH